VSLVQHALEAAGIVTASLTAMPDLTRRLAPPRALAVPFGLGAPLGAPGDAAGHRRVLMALLALLPRTDLPVLEAFAAGR
jgi:hypothetical protein